MPKPVHSLLDGLVDRFASMIAARAGYLFAHSAAARRFSKESVRLCRYPGCTMAGAGPRNRWFCREHARSVPVAEQKRILAQLASEKAVLARTVRGGRSLNMRCRLEGCDNMSRGPRFGYICDEHRSELTVKEQRIAREKWNASHARALAD